MGQGKIIFVSHCLLNSIPKSSCNGSSKKIIKMLLESDVNIIQIPCPEIEFKENGDEFEGKYKTACKKISSKISKKIKKYLRADYNVLGIIGVEFSRTCAVYRVGKNRRVEYRKGVLIEEIEKRMEKMNFQVPILAFNPLEVSLTVEKLRMLLRN